MNASLLLFTGPTWTEQSENIKFSVDLVNEISIMWDEDPLP